MNGQGNAVDVLMGVGGTGNRFLETIVMLSLIRYIHERDKIKVILVDEDTNNGNFNETSTLIERYKAFRKIISGSGKSPISLENEIVFANGRKEKMEIVPSKYIGDSVGNMSFSDIIGQDSLTNGLFKEEDLNLTLESGFKGKVHVGSVVFSQAKRGLSNIFRNVVAGATNLNVFIVGSLFGGTGAAGIPTIARIIKDNGFPGGGDVNKRIGALLILSYFGVEPPPDNGNNECPQISLSVSLNRVREALRTYYANNDDIDVFYLIGSYEPLVKTYPWRECGGFAQKNENFVIEIFAGAFYKHFLNNPNDNAGNIYRAFVDDESLPDVLEKEDIPYQDELVKGIESFAKFRILLGEYWREKHLNIPLSDDVKKIIDELFESFDDWFLDVFFDMGGKKRVDLKITHTWEKPKIVFLREKITIDILETLRDIIKAEKKDAKALERVDKNQEAISSFIDAEGWEVSIGDRMKDKDLIRATWDYYFK